ncbi:hypothetical protein V5097_04165 [Arenibacter palladensis]
MMVLFSFYTTPHDNYLSIPFYNSIYGDMDRENSYFSHREI